MGFCWFRTLTDQVQKWDLEGAEGVSQSQVSPAYCRKTYLYWSAAEACHMENKRNVFTSASVSFSTRENL